VQISINTATDSAAMKTISVLGLVFLPGTFICVFSPPFSFSRLDYTNRKQVAILHDLLQFHPWVRYSATAMGHVRKILDLLRGRLAHHVAHYRVLVRLDKLLFEASCDESRWCYAISSEAVDL
jgi:hypothetical protein